jgi:hypothetical protein
MNYPESLAEVLKSFESNDEFRDEFMTLVLEEGTLQEFVASEILHNAWGDNPWPIALSRMIVLGLELGILMGKNRVAHFNDPNHK